MRAVRTVLLSAAAAATAAVTIAAGALAAPADEVASPTRAGSAVTDTTTDDDDMPAPPMGPEAAPLTLTGILPDGVVEDGTPWTASDTDLADVLEQQLGSGYAQITCADDLVWGTSNSVRCHVGEGEFADTTWTAYPVHAPVGYEPGGTPSVLFVQHVADDTEPLEPIAASGITDATSAVTGREISAGYNDQDIPADVLTQHVADAVASPDSLPGVDRTLEGMSCSDGLEAEAWDAAFCTARTHDGQLVELYTFRGEYISGHEGLVIVLKNFH